MDTSDARRPPADPLDAAAYWFARDSGGLMSAAERIEFDAWRRADPAHERAYREMLDTWARGPCPTTRCARCARRRLSAASPAAAGWLGLGASACAAAAVGLASPGWWPASTLPAQRATARGERRRVDLEDGSVLTLNTGTQAEVRHAFRAAGHPAPRRRDHAGSIARRVPSLHRRHRDRRVRVTGTRFNVRHDGGQMAVAVESGSVEVIAGPWWNGQRVKLPAGYGVRMAGGGETVRIQPVDVATLTAWRQGKAVFNDTPLAEVAREINRYRAQPSRSRPRWPACASPASSTWTTPAPSSSPLPALVPLRVQPRADGGADLLAR